jgi:hypothetical protein
VTELRQQHAADLAAQLDEQRVQLSREFEATMAATERDLVRLNAFMFINNTLAFF